MSTTPGPNAKTAGDDKGTIRYTVLTQMLCSDGRQRQKHAQNQWGRLQVRAHKGFCTLQRAAQCWLHTDKTWGVTEASKVSERRVCTHINICIKWNYQLIRPTEPLIENIDICCRHRQWIKRALSFNLLGCIGFISISYITLTRDVAGL